MARAGPAPPVVAAAAAQQPASTPQRWGILSDLSDSIKSQFFRLDGLWHQ